MRAFSIVPRIVAVISMAVAVAGLAQADNFTDSTKANVLRQYNQKGVFLVSVVHNTVGCSDVGRYGSNDGGGWNDEATGFDAGDTFSAEYTLPAAVSVGSYRVQWDGGRVPTTFLLEGYVGGLWTTLYTTNPTGDHTASFSPQTVTKLRYTGTGPSLDAGIYFAMRELQVFVASAATADLYGGYNLMRDTGRVTGGGQSDGTKAFPYNGTISGGPWSRMYDGGVSDENHARNNPPTTNAYFYYTFDRGYRMEFAVIAGYKGLGYQSVSVWTAPAGALPAPDADTGWTLQATANVNDQGNTKYTFATPGRYQYLRLTFPGWISSQSMDEMELYGFVLKKGTIIFLR